MKSVLAWLLSFAMQPPVWWTLRLRLALLFSVFFHILWLSLNFGFSNIGRVSKNKALDVILVNKRSPNKPSDAQAFAQAHQDGGGNVDDNRRASTPFPIAAHDKDGKEIEQAQRRIQQLEARQRELMTQVASPRKVAPHHHRVEQRQPTPSENDGLDLAENARAMARLEGEIARSFDEYNKRPRKKNIGTRTEEYRFARYIEDWRAKIERIGTLNYPPAARGKIYGNLILSVALRADGSIQNINIDRPSGHPVLDEAAARIVRLGAPYAPFPPDIRRDVDILEITRTWSFTSSNELRAE